MTVDDKPRVTADDKLRALGRELPWDRPDPARREAVRASLLLAAEDAAPRRDRRGLAIGGAFALGVAAAATVLVVLRGGSPPASGVAAARLRAQIRSSSAAELEHTVVATATGSDEIVRVHAGTVRVAAPVTSGTEHVWVQTHDAAVEGAGDYEIVVARDQLASVTVHTGTARITVVDHAQPVFLAAGETWHAAVTTRDVLTPDAGVVTASAAPVTPSDPSMPASDPAVPALSAASAPASAAAAGPSVPPPASPRAPKLPALEPALASPPVPASADRVASSAATGAAPADPGAAPAPVAPAPSSESPAASARADDRPTEPLHAQPDASHAATPPAHPDAPIERHFQAGWALLRTGDARAAATELGLAADAGDAARDPLASDARYFQAVALIKAGAAPAAEHALVAFLDHALRSLRRGRASIMLARLIAQRGDLKSARAWFESALHDPDPEVTTAARAGLAALPR